MDPLGLPVTRRSCKIRARRASYGQHRAVCDTMARMTVTPAVSLIYFRPCEGRDGEDIHIIEKGVVSSSAAVHVSDPISIYIRDYQTLDNSHITA